MSTRSEGHSGSTGQGVAVRNKGKGCESGSETRAYRTWKSHANEDVSGSVGCEGRVGCEIQLLHSAKRHNLRHCRALCVHRHCQACYAAHQQCHEGRSTRHDVVRLNLAALPLHFPEPCRPRRSTSWARARPASGHPCGDVSPSSTPAQRPLRVPVRRRRNCQSRRR